MPYIGNQPAEQFTSFATQEFSTSATTSYTLDHAVTNENEIALFINNVRQQPGSGKAYTATSTTLTLSEATASTDTMYCVFLGRALQTVTPATNSITAAMISDDAVTGAKLNTDVISAQTALGAEPADTDEFLVSDAGVLKRVDYSYIKGGGITEADQWRLSSTFSGSGTLTSNLERVDGTLQGYLNSGTGMSQSSGVFTFPSTGIWEVIATFELDSQTNASYMDGQIEATSDNSSYADVALARGGHAGNTGADDRGTFTCSTILDITDTSNHKVRFVVDNSSGSTVGDSTVNRTHFTFIRLGDT